MERLDKVRAAHAEAVGARLFIEVSEDEQAGLCARAPVSDGVI